MLRKSWTRRDFIVSISVGGTLAAFDPIVQANAFSRSSRIRKDINSLDPVGPEIAALRAGVAQMRSRKVTDPTSWNFQANIHGTLDDPTNDLWAQCQHGQWWFLPWHRMYLYYFEQILIAAIKEANVPVPADFGLPYWNYSDLASSRVIPQVFREPTYRREIGGPDLPNPLYESSRRKDLNDHNSPKALEADTINTSAALSLTTFVSSPFGSDGFGGQQVSAPKHLPNLEHGGLEHAPHDLIHDAIQGLMGDPDTAANDPIFWLHHCNVDRLWNKWLNQGDMRADPLDQSTWCQQRFSFVDGNGKKITKSVIQFLTYAPDNLLDYHYDDPTAADPSGPANQCATPALIAEAPPNKHPAMRPMHSAAVATTLSSFPPKVLLTDKQATFKLEVPQEHHASVAQLGTGEALNAGELSLEISGIDPSSINGGHYDVYINLPTTEEPKHSSSSFLGTISSFSLKGKSRHLAEGGAPELSRTFLLNAIAKKLTQDNRWTHEQLTVTFVPREMGPEQPDATRLVFQRLNLVRRPPVKNQ